MKNKNILSDDPNDAIMEEATINELDNMKVLNRNASTAI